MDEKLDAVVTMQRKGYHLNAVANVLNLPVVVIRKTIKLLKVLRSPLTMFQAHQKIETMVLSKRTLAENSNV